LPEAAISQIFENMSPTSFVVGASPPLQKENRHFRSCANRPSFRSYFSSVCSAQPSSSEQQVSSSSSSGPAPKPTPTLHHVSLLTSDTQRTVKFYVDVLGFEVATGSAKRPQLKFPGEWLVAGPDGLAIHLIELPNPDPVEGRPAYVGHDRHTAFSIEDLDTLIASLGSAKVPYRLSSSGRKAAFFRDPDGNGLEFIEIKH